MGIYFYSLAIDQLHLLESLAGTEGVGFEIRLDTSEQSPDPTALRERIKKPLIATYRSIPHLGKADPDTREYTGWKRRLACLEAGFEYIDVELDEDDIDEKIEHIHQAGAKVILSHHALDDWAQLDEPFARMIGTKADIVKLIGTGRGTIDYHRQREFYKRLAPERLVQFYMGADHAATRVLSLVYGAPLTFIATDPDKAVAPGQLTLPDLTAVFRPHEVSLDRLKLFGVIGSPIGHSKSPAYHNSPLKEIDPNALFLSFLVRKEGEFNILRETFPELRGLAVTKPMKELAAKETDLFEDNFSRELGAVNTLLFKDSNLHATNTDFLAIQEILRHYAPGKKVLVIGYGGLGKAVAQACSSLNIEAAVCNRTRSRLRNLPPGVKILEWEMRDRTDAQVLVQTTSVGMAPDVNESPLPFLPKTAELVVETIYNPRTTKLMQMAEERNVPTIDGMELFNRQAKIQNGFFKQVCKG